ncbi:MAG: non-ribosomal peptide synthetase, partial [Terriglobales bacterium]
AYAAGSRPFALEASLFGALAEMARAVRATPFMVLVAAFAVLLHRLGGQEAVIIGTPAAGRSQRRWERIAGPLVNTLPLRLVCDGNPPFGAVVRQARDAVLEALGHQDYPFALAMRAAPRAAGVAPNLEAYLSLQPPAETPPAGWSMSHLAVDNGTAKFPLHLDMAWTGAGAVEGRCRYQRARVDPSLGGELADCWTVLLAAATKDWQQRIGALPLLSAARRRQMVALGQGPAPQMPPGTLAEIFARQAAAMAERVAIVALESSRGGAPARRREIHYRDLRADVEQVAGGLRAAGIRPGDTVALALPRSAAAVTAMLAVIWCGAAYVPLRPEDPLRRRQSQLEQAGARWVIAESPDDDSPAALAAAPAPVAAQTLTMAALRARGANACPPPAAGAEAAHAPAYVMFTSGSTGEPQAVRIPPAGIVRLAAQPGYADLGPKETFLQLAPLSFDAATFEIWAPLLNGGRLVIPPPGLPSVAELGDWIRREGVTTLWLTATLFNAVVDTDPAVLAPLRQLLTGGEALSPRHVRQAQQALPRMALFNGYGPTENTTFTCVYRIPAGTDGAIPLGRPIAHTAAYVVDGYGAPAPLGSEGELWAGGVGLAREYVGGDPAARWVQPGWAAGERLFRTGDRARWTEASGGPVLEFLGRRDQQVKLRGMRLDLAGLEALLLRHPQVRQAAVMVADAGGGELTGYVATEASAEALSGWLARDLPAAMIPARWVLRAELPRLASGKLDRQALRLLPAGRRTASAPAGETERRLAAIWGELLGREAVGRDEDFYALGGHSLLGLRMLARMEREFGRRLSLAEMLAHRTVAAQAQWIDGARAEAAADEPRAVRMQAGDPAARPQFFSLEAVGRFLRLAEAMGPQQPWYGLRLAGLTELPHPCPLEAVAAYHLATL